jgi:hypothetical protein
MHLTPSQAILLAAPIFPDYPQADFQAVRIKIGYRIQKDKCFRLHFWAKDVLLMMLKGKYHSPQ